MKIKIPKNKQYTLKPVEPLQSEPVNSFAQGTMIIDHNQNETI